jgi:hypothetical protein
MGPGDGGSGVTAQTNLQLGRQLVRAGWDDDDLARIAAGYDLAVQLFAGAVRSSGKPFVCHLVGTASVVADHSDDPDLVAAALLHAAYDQGDFADGRRGRTSGRAAVVRDAIGERAEALVTAYDRLAVDDGLLAGLERRAEDLSEHERRMLVLLLANEADDHLDHGIAALGPDLPWRYRPDTVERLVAVGRAAGLTGLADRLDAAAADPAEVAAPLRRDVPKTSIWVHRHPVSVKSLPWGRLLKLSPVVAWERARRARS